MQTLMNSAELYSLGLLVLRITLGSIMFAHGAQKVLGWFGGYGLKATTGHFKNALHIPAPLAYIAAYTEFLGGIAIAAGVLTRLAALGFVVTMAVAIQKVHIKNGFFLNSGADGKGVGIEFNLALLAMGLLLVLTGPGAFALAN